MASRPKTPAPPVDKLPTAELMAEIRNLVGALGQRTLGSVTDRISSATERLTEYAGSASVDAITAPDKKRGKGSGGGASGSAVAGGLGAGLKGAAKGVAKGAAKGVAKGAAQTAKKALGGADKGGKKITNIVESIDVGVSVDVAYNQWTLFSEFPSFMKHVELVEQESDEKLRWRAKIGLSRRSWESTIIEQVPDQRIVWRSSGDKGYVDGAVTFHELGPELTRVVLVLEYHPVGVVERVGNFWRAQGRRARADLRHFQRHVMTQTILHSEELEGWRGEIHDSQVAEPGDEAEPEPAEESEEEPAAKSRPTKQRRTGAGASRPRRRESVDEEAAPRKAARRRAAPEKRSEAPERRGRRASEKPRASDKPRASGKTRASEKPRASKRTRASEKTGRGRTKGRESSDD